MNRKLGIDYGLARIGIARSDLLGIIANPLITIKHNEDIDITIDEIIKLANDNKVDAIVVGMPLNMDGSKGQQSEITINFIEKLKEKTEINIFEIDERRTSSISKQTLREYNISEKQAKEKGLIDMISASLILQTYLDKNN